MSKSSGSTTVNVPPPSEQELELGDFNSDFVRAQLGAFNRAMSNQTRLWNSAYPGMQRQRMEDAAFNEMVSPEQMAAFRLDEMNRASERGQMDDEIARIQLDQLRRGGKATPEEEAYIDQIMGGQIAAGKSGIERFMSEGLDSIANELAPARGLRPTDSPIQDRAFKLGGEAMRMYGDLETGIRTAGAEAKLNYPLAKAGVMNQSAQFQQNLGQSIRDFQLQLKAQADMNRQQLALGANSQLFGGMSSVGSPFALQTGLANARTAGAGRSFSQSGFDLGGAGQFLGGVGGFLAGGGGALFGLSDLHLKEDVKLIGRHKDGFGIYSFRFKGQPVAHIGVIAQEVMMVRPDAVTRDRKTGYLMVDYEALELQ